MSLVFPVIHHIDLQTTKEQATIAQEAGADGVFLISHTGANLGLPEFAQVIRHMTGYSDKFKVGINLLGADPVEAADRTFDNRLDMMWGDECGVWSKGLSFRGEKLRDWAKRYPKIDIFASVAFKYQVEDPDPVQAAINALNCGFIPTTSGQATGSAPDIAKIKGMSEATNGRLAVASGMSVENISEFAPYLSHILVSTGVSVDFHHFDKEILTEFIKKAKNL